jgi:hypothetical protein
MRKSLMILILMAQPALADEWATLTGAQITQALTARLLQYDGGERQQFNADGTTLYESPDASHGQWRVTGDQYCSQWPPSDRWSCYDVEGEATGLNIRFIAGDGSVSTGRYIDLR